MLVYLHYDLELSLCVVFVQPEDQSLVERWQHFSDLADFALAMKVTLNNLNNQSFNNFMLRIGAFEFAHTQICVGCPFVDLCFLVQLIQVSTRAEFWLE